ncbi:MAG: hypothetical protein OSJ58_09660 [Dysosmobacter sp.]|nr:hypothetical protein [Dysosmobacter sp.]
MTYGGADRPPLLIQYRELAGRFRQEMLEAGCKTLAAAFKGCL